MLISYDQCFVLFGFPEVSSYRMMEACVGGSQHPVFQSSSLLFGLGAVRWVVSLRLLSRWGDIGIVLCIANGSVYVLLRFFFAILVFGVFGFFGIFAAVLGPWRIDFFPLRFGWKGCAAFDQLGNQIFFRAGARCLAAMEFVYFLNRI